LKAVANAQAGWRRVIAQGTYVLSVSCAWSSLTNSLWGIPIPAHTTALSFFDGYRTETLPANLIQAQRDFFGAHTFRVQPGFENDDMKAGQDIHVKWTATSGNVRTPYSPPRAKLMKQVSSSTYNA